MHVYIAIEHRATGNIVTRTSTYNIYENEREEKNLTRTSAGVSQDVPNSTPVRSRVFGRYLKTYVRRAFSSHHRRRPFEATNRVLVVVVAAATVVVRVLIICYVYIICSYGRL